MPFQSSSPHIELGKLGETTVANHLKRKHYKILSQNYRKKCGELDLVTEKAGVVHFFEVKSVSYETDRRNFLGNTWLPEENVDHRKVKKLLRTIEIWLLEHKCTAEWQLDVASVWIDRKEKKGRIKIIENITGSV